MSDDNPTGGYPPEPDDGDLWDRFDGGGPADKIEALKELGDRELSRRKFASARALYEQALEIAVSVNRQIDRYELLARVARSMSALGESDAALQLIARHEPEARSLLESRELSFYYRAKAFVYQDLRLALEALEALRASEALARDAEDWDSVAFDVGAQVRLLMILRDHTTAVELIDRALPEAEENAYIYSVIQLMHTRARLHIEMREYAAAAEIMREALLVDDHPPFLNHRIAMEITLATALVHLGDHADAEATLDRTEEFLGNASRRYKVKAGILRGQISHGAEATTHRQRARARARRDGMHHLGNVCDINDAMRLVHAGNFAEAERLLRLAMSDAEEHGDTNLVYEARIRLAAVLVEVRRADEAMAVLADLSEAHFGDDLFLAWRYRTVLGSALVDIGDLDAAVDAVSPVFAVAPTLEHYGLLADAHYVLARVEEANEGRSGKWAKHLGKSVAYLHRVGDLVNAEQRSEEFLDDDANHPERILDQEEALRAFHDRTINEASDE